MVLRTKINNFVDVLLKKAESHTTTILESHGRLDKLCTVKVVSK